MDSGTTIDLAAPEPADAAPDSGRQALKACPLCKSRRLHYAFSRFSYRVVRCADCRLLMSNPQPSDRELADIYGKRYFLGRDDGPGQERVSRMKTATARRYLAQIARYRGQIGGALLEIGCGQGELAAEAENHGYDVTAIEVSSAASDAARRRLRTGRVICATVESASLPSGDFDVCVLSDVIEHVRDPLAHLRLIGRLLKPSGTLCVATPSLDSWSSRLLRQNWMEFKPEHLTYFDNNTIQNALFLGGFGLTLVLPGWKVLNAQYVAEHFARFPVPVISTLVQLATRTIPRQLRQTDVPVVASGMLVLARSSPLRPRRKLSVIIPAYNERSTIQSVLQAVLSKHIADLEMEIILVESNSTDGTRQALLPYADHPQVKLILEERPRGKGRAVRTALKHATGDFILIQDADLEYDVEDYDALLEPLIEGREALVLGSRHGGRAWWKMRKFTDQPFLALFTNCGHWFFTMLLNVLFNQRLKDPFTMFKVFRRDCLTGLSFRCNRFDFDIELLVKLIRKGYRPVEIPVNYRSRSYKQGKKVNALRDPWTWLRALAWLRLVKLDTLRQVEMDRRLP
jgi:SAM-dependent methyltransferase